MVHGVDATVRYIGCSKSHGACRVPLIHYTARLHMFQEPHTHKSINGRRKSRRHADISMLEL